MQIEGVPFEIKSIFGLETETAAPQEGKAITAGQDDQEKECVLCLSEDKDTLIMPCGHFCVCAGCGQGLVKAKQTCPICREHIASLIPIKHK